MDEREDSRALGLPYLNFALTPEQERLIERWSVVNAGPNKAITPSMRHSAFHLSTFPRRFLSSPGVRTKNLGLHRGAASFRQPGR